MVDTLQLIKTVVADGSSATMDTGTLTGDLDVLRVVVEIEGGGSGGCRMRFNSDTGSNYRRLFSENGGSKDGHGDGANDNIANMVGRTGRRSYSINTIYNISGKETSGYGHCITDGGNTGSANAPTRMEYAFKWANTAQITSIQIISDSTSWASGSTLNVYAYSRADEEISDEKTTISDIPTNTRYEEIDTRKIYRRVAGGTTSQETQNGGELFNDVEIVSQKFTSGSSKIGLIVDSVDVFIRNDTGSVSTSTNIECKIGQEWSSGVSYGTKSPSALSTSYSWQNFTPASAKRTIVENDRLMIRWADGTVTNDSIRWGSDNNASNQLPNETGEYSADDGSNWTARSFDRCYKINYSAQWKERGTA